MYLTDYFGRKGPTTLLTNTPPAVGASAATPVTGSQPDLTNRLLQIMSWRFAEVSISWKSDNPAASYARNSAAEDG